MEKTVVKALGLLEELARSDKARGVSELGRSLGLSKSNVHRLLETLLQLGYVQRTESGSYALGLKLWQLSALQLAKMDIRELCKPYLEELVTRTGETSRLTVFETDHGVCIQQVQGDHPVGVMTRVGGTLSATCSATGKALLAYQPEETIRRVAATLERRTPRSIATEAELRREIAQIRAQGFALNRGEWTPSVTGVAAPVWNGNGEVVASLGISGPATRLTRKVLVDTAPILRDVALRLSAELGYAVPDARVALR